MVKWVSIVVLTDKIVYLMQKVNEINARGLVLAAGTILRDVRFFNFVVVLRELVARGELSLHRCCEWKIITFQMLQEENYQFDIVTLLPITLFCR